VAEIQWPQPTGEAVRASVDVTERYYTCSLPAPTPDHLHRIVVARVRAHRDPLVMGDWTIEVADLTRKHVSSAFPVPLWSQQVDPDWVDIYGTKLAQRIVHVLWLDDRRQWLAREVADDWRSADTDKRAEATP